MRTTRASRRFHCRCRCHTLIHYDISPLMLLFIRHAYADSAPPRATPLSPLYRFRRHYRRATLMR